jgi:hypothetical protein
MNNDATEKGPPSSQATKMGDPADATLDDQKTNSELRLDDLLDEALEETFPASDPVAVHRF